MISHYFSPDFQWAVRSWGCLRYTTDTDPNNDGYNVLRGNEFVLE